jgi:hypothetical protein
MPDGKTMLALTVDLAMRIAIVWAAGILLAVAVSAILPVKAGLSFAGKQTTIFLSYSRAGFWTCILAALTVTGLIVFRAIAADIGLTK